jgi:hypothetical protein
MCSEEVRNFIRSVNGRNICSWPGMCVLYMEGICVIGRQCVFCIWMEHVFFQEGICVPGQAFMRSLYRKNMCSRSGMCVLYLEGTCVLFQAGMCSRSGISCVQYIEGMCSEVRNAYSSSGRNMCYMSGM